MTVINNSGKTVFIKESSVVEIAVRNGETRTINNGTTGLFRLISMGPMVIFQPLEHI